MSASERGVSLLAALVFVAILSVAAVGIQSVAPSSNPQALTAATGGTGSDTIASEQKRAASEIGQKCAAAIKWARANGNATSQKGQTARDDCVAAIKTNDPAYKNTNGYKCVGKSAQIQMKDSGTISINWQANPNVLPGTCKAVACRPSWNLIDKITTVPTVARCFVSELSSIDKEKITSGLDGSGSFSAQQVRGTNYMIPGASLDKTSLDILNTAFGRDPNDTTGYISLDPKGDFASPEYDQIARLAGENPNPAVEQVSKDITLNDATLQQVQLSPDDKAPCPGAGPVKCPPLPPTQPCPGPNCRDTTGFGGKRGGGGNENDGERGKSGGGGLGSLMPLLASFLKGLMGSPQAPAQACQTDPNAYAQQQQQYQQQLQQYNYQLQQYQYQQQLNSAYGLSSMSAPEPIRPAPCTPSTSQQCQSQPPQPPAQNCNAGTWRPTYNGACITNWQCTSSGAQISCQPQVADVGMTLAISYSCSAGTATGNGFTASTSPSGSATTTVAAPPAGTNTAIYRLTCNNNGVTAGAQCSVQVTLPTIVLVANPKTVHSGDTSLIGWITTSMQSCVVSSPDDSNFTSRNSSNTSVAGTATTSPITATTNFLLHCQTIGGGTRDATTTVSIF